MAIVEVKVPQLSESVAEATMLQWKKKAGEAVAVDEILIEISIALGKTYSEIADLPYREIKKYTAYIRKYGSLNLGRRFEQELARIHQSILMLKGVKDVKLHDLMTHEEKPKEELSEFDFDD